MGREEGCSGWVEEKEKRRREKEAVTQVHDSWGQGRGCCSPFSAGEVEMSERERVEDLSSKSNKLNS